MWTLTALQYTQGHGVYKPPQFYLHPSRAYITPAARIKPFIVLLSSRTSLSLVMRLWRIAFFLSRRALIYMRLESSVLVFVIIGASRTLGITFGVVATDIPLAIASTTFSRRTVRVSAISGSILRKSVVIDNFADATLAGENLLAV